MIDGVVLEHRGLAKAGQVDTSDRSSPVILRVVTNARRVARPPELLALRVARQWATRSHIHDSLSHSLA